jgi:non-canonical (house-cleaning) NTP pyrophosphatase
MSDKIKNPLLSSSNLPPPSELPSFLLSKKAEEEKDVENSSIESSKKSEKQQIVKEENQKQAITTSTAIADGDPEEKRDLLPAIPMQDIAQALTPITEGVKNSMFYGFLKDSFKNSMEIAKDSVQKVVVTLDPQMSGILYSGGDIEVIVASNNEDKIDPARQAFQQIFKKATVYGHGAQVKTIAAQPIGFESAELSAKERINSLRSSENFVDKVILSVENFIIEAYNNQWFDLGLLMLSDPKNNITLKTFTQMTPIPYELIQKMQTETPQDYDKKATGYSVTVGGVMAKYLNVPHFEWHNAFTSIDRYSMILNACISLASIYKFELQKKEDN